MDALGTNTTKESHNIQAHWEQSGVGAFQIREGQNVFCQMFPMPNRQNTDRRHHILKMRFKVQNLPEYEGDLSGVAA